MHNYTTTNVWFNKEKVDLYASGGGSFQKFVDSGMDMSMISTVMAQLQAYPVVTLNGKQYYKAETQKDKEYFYPKSKDDNAIVTKDSFKAGQRELVEGALFYGRQQL